jgi:hypothetical protein
MKNILIYINPSEKFDEESEKLIKIQIESSLELGWKPEDILLITNFPYEFMGVKAFEISGEYYCKLFKQATKVDVMVHLFDTGFFKEGVLYWMHDLDAYQQECIDEKELELDGYFAGLTDYGRNERWNGGSMFIKKELGDFMKKVKEKMYKDNENNKGIWKNEEDVYMDLTRDNIDNINSKLKRLNITYNFGIKQMKLCYEKALKPIKVLHFHPERVYRGWGRAMDIVCGNNELGFPIMSEKLTKIFEKYGITKSN